MVVLNRAVATAMMEGPAAGLELLDSLDDRIGGHHRLPPEVGRRRQPRGRATRRGVSSLRPARCGPTRDPRAVPIGPCAGLLLPDPIASPSLQLRLIHTLLIEENPVGSKVLRSQAQDRPDACERRRAEPDDAASSVVRAAGRMGTRTSPRWFF